MNLRLPAVTVGTLAPPSHAQLALAAAGVALAAIVAVLPREPAAAPSERAAPVAAPGALAVRVPYAWLAATPPVAAGDRLEVLGSTAAEGATVVVVIAPARVLSVEADALVLELSPDDVIALAVARAHSYLLLPAVPAP